MNRGAFPDRRSQAGAALLTVLTVLAILGILVSLVFDRIRGDIRPWAREAEEAQAFYLAESGIAYQLYLENWSDSANPAFGPPDEGDSAGSAAEDIGFGESKGPPLWGKAPTDSFAFRLDSGLGTPRVRVDRGRSFLDMTSRGKYRNAEATIHARFGKALDDTLFGPALTLDNEIPVESFSANQVTGTMRIRNPAPGMATLPFPAGFSVQGYAGRFVDDKYREAEADLRKRLADPDAQKGNAHFTPREPPRFGRDGNVVYALGSMDFRNDGRDTWVIRGPGRIYCEGEIRLKGDIRLVDIGLFSGKSITFEDSVSGESVSAFAAGSVFIHDRCRLGIEAVAVKDIVLRDRAQTLAGSVLISTGSTGPAAKGGDSLNAIRVVNEASARGFLIAAGPNGRVAMATPANRIEGVIIAQAAWLAGEVDGAVLAGKLLCEGTNRRNCLGPGVIRRDRLPRSFVQPLDLGPRERGRTQFQLLAWRRD